MNSRLILGAKGETEVKAVAAYPIGRAKDALIDEGHGGRSAFVMVKAQREQPKAPRYFLRWHGIDAPGLLAQRRQG